HLPQGHGVRSEANRRRWAAEILHSYLRLTPELRARFDGPHVPGEPPARGARHPVLDGFDETDLLPFGGTLDMLSVEPSAQVLATFVPPFPSSPPEDDWMRVPATTIPGLVIHERPSQGRVAYIPADV